MHSYKSETVFQWDLRAPESHFTVQSSPLLLPKLTLCLFLPYNLYLPVSSGKNYSSWVAEAAASAYAIYLPPFCALLGRVPKANTSLVALLLCSLRHIHFLVWEQVLFLYPWLICLHFKDY